MTIEFNSAFEMLTGHTPMGWQRRLYAEFVRGCVPPALDLPTGLGKTSVIVIWLIAFAQGGAARGLPRRLVYVVDRRVVVDQATEEAQRIADRLQADYAIAQDLRKRLGVEAGELAVSTLRGGRAEDRDWTYDPAAPAIIVGTVDLIGSRLLFSGYRLSRWSRPLQAGLLGADSLIVLDEAHLSPAFDCAVRRVRALCEQATPAPIPKLQLLPLSATPGGGREDNVFRLTEEDYENATVRRRTGRERPTKRLKFEQLGSGKDILSETLAKHAAAHDGAKRAVLVYCDSRDAANKTALELRNLLGKERAADVELITGARRGHERDKLTTKLTYRAFGPPAENDIATGKIEAERGWPTDHRTRYLACTAAGEVGADLDAEAAVMDLVPLERMVQRLGRVNRRGNCAEPAPVTIFCGPDDRSADDDKKGRTEEALRLAATKDALERHLRELDDSGLDGSPDQIGRMLRALGEEGRNAAFTTPPKIPAIERDHVEAWALTSLKGHPGRPEVDPFLHGEMDEEPQTTVVWRADVPYLANLPEKSIERALEAVPLRPPELLEAPTREVTEMLHKRIAAIRKGWKRAEEERTHSGKPGLAILVRRRDKVTIGWLFRDSFLLGRERVDVEDKRLMTSHLSGATVLLDPEIGGLSEDGALADRDPLIVGDDVQTEHERWRKMHVEPNVLIRLVPGFGDEERPPKLLAFPQQLCEAHPEIKFAALTPEQARKEKLQGLRLAGSVRLPPPTEDEDATGDLLEYWGLRWDIDGETAAAKQPQSLEDHHRCAGVEMRRIATRLGLDRKLTDCLVLAIELHDFGKDRERWQRAVRASRDVERYGLSGPLAKTTSRVTGDLGGYRHEFGSLRDALSPCGYHNRMQALDEPFRELALHLIAAHHGRARAFIPAIDGDEKDVFGTILPETAFDAAKRYVRLQRSWGPWGLAWLEALLRAADAAVSRQLDNPEPKTAEAAE